MNKFLVSCILLFFVLDTAVTLLLFSRVKMAFMEGIEYQKKVQVQEARIAKESEAKAAESATDKLRILEGTSPTGAPPEKP